MIYVTLNKYKRGTEKYLSGGCGLNHATSGFQKDTHENESHYFYMHVSLVVWWLTNHIKISFSYHSSTTIVISKFFNQVFIFGIFLN